MSDVENSDAEQVRARSDSTPDAVVGPTASDGRLAEGTLGAAHIVFMVVAAVAPAGGAVALPHRLGDDRGRGW
ncbi:hypothetical protein ACFUN7_03155 [Streptomyces sp. NPDC057236]|uniref:hypothetical protein n=1 Tax=Streptomyces sp. NPDC057236 TaxID=3346059 RepID=UPI003640D57E